MPEPLPAKDGQRRRDAVQHALDIDVDHLLPLFDAQVVERGDQPHSGIVDEDVELAEPLRGQLDEASEIVAPPHVGAGEGCLSARSNNSVGESMKPIRPARAEHELRAPLGQQERGGLADSAAGAGDDDHLALNFPHEVRLRSLRLSAPKGSRGAVIGARLVPSDAALNDLRNRRNERHRRADRVAVRRQRDEREISRPDYRLD